MSEIIDELLEDIGQRMQKSVDSCKQELGSVRTGRATPHLLDRVMVDYYGARTPLNQVANIAIDGRMLSLTPFDKSMIGKIEKAINESDIGIAPSNDGNLIRLKVPDLNEERRRDLVKVVHGLAEDGRIAVRNVRRECMQDLRDLDKDGDIGEDEKHRAEADLQKLTDTSIGAIDVALKAKEEEVLEV